MSAGAWTFRGDTVIYDSPWVRLVTADVVMPDGTQVDHHVARMPRPAVGTIMMAGGQLLMLYRHRFITDSWGWEIPAGGVDAGEALADAARREALEESGWEPTTVERLCSFNPANGLLDQTFHIFTSRDATHHGDPVDRNEAAFVEWLPFERVLALLASGEITDGLTFGAIAYGFATSAIG